MTTPAKIQANRRNARRSTGPKTAAGKAVVARNAVTHGAFAAVPVLPTERPADWETHRVGVVASLAPAGHLELALAERTALLLWRLARLARYEALTTAAALEAADLPDDPDPLADFPIPGRPKPPAERATDARRTAKLARDSAAELEPAAALVDGLAARPAGHPVPMDLASHVLHAAWGEAEERGRKTVCYEDDAFLAALGQAAGDVYSVEWTAGLLRDALGYYAGCLGWPPERLTSEVVSSLRREAAEAHQRAEAAEVEAAALAGLAERSRGWKRAGLLIPADAVEAKVVRYEAHLSRQLQLTLTQLERLQKARAGEPVPPPLALDVNLSSDAPPG